MIRDEDDVIMLHVSQRRDEDGSSSPSSSHYYLILLLNQIETRVAEEDKRQEDQSVDTHRKYHSDHHRLHDYRAEFEPLQVL